MTVNKDSEITDITSWVRQELEANTDLKYREFHKSLVPGLENLLVSGCLSCARSLKQQPG